MIKLATQIAMKSTHKAYFHSAIVTRGGRVIATGYNNILHAEEAALNKLWPSERKGSRVWSIRVTKSGILANAKPCPNCQKLMKAEGVKMCFYSTSESKIERMKL